MQADTAKQVITASEGLSGYMTFKTGEQPKVDGRDFVFVSEKACEFGIEQWESDYTLSDFSTVQQLVVQNGKRRRAALQS